MEAQQAGEAVDCEQPGGPAAKVAGSISLTPAIGRPCIGTMQALPRLTIIRS